jgi:hypothetical protein
MKERGRTMKYQMAKAKVWWPLLAALGATERRSYVAIDGDALEARFGLFRRRIPLSEISASSLAMKKVPWYRYSIGWRTDFVRRVALLSAARNVVGLKLKRARWTWLLGFPVRMGELFISMEDPEGFLKALREAGVPVANAGLDTPGA